MNIAHNVERGQRFFPNKTALIFEGKSFTYKALDKLANRVANGLRGLGISRGDRVALFLPNIPEFIISYLGILKLGAVAVSLNVMLKRGEVKFILNDLPVEVVQRWKEKHGRVIYSGYGLTETSPFASYNHDLKYKFGSIGTPIENVEMKIVNCDGQEVKPGELGEIIIRGPNVMLGYWNRPFETAQVLKNGWFHTGDMGWMDEDGYFYIVGSLKDTINVFGFKVYPAEVENAIYQHPAVAR